MFGRELRLPIDLLYGRPSEERPKNTSLYAEQLFRILEDTHDFARKSLELASDKMNSYYDSRSSQRHLKVGDAVWLYNPERKKGLSPKLSRPWQGPYVVTKCILLNDLIFEYSWVPERNQRSYTTTVCGSTAGRTLQPGFLCLTSA